MARETYLPWSCRPGMLAVYAPLGAGSGTYLAGGVRDLILPLLLARRGGGAGPCLPISGLHNAEHWPGKGSQLSSSLTVSLSRFRMPLEHQAFGSNVACHHKAQPPGSSAASQLCCSSLICCVNLTCAQLALIYKGGGSRAPCLYEHCSTADLLPQDSA